MDKLHNLMQSGTAGGPPGMPSLKSMLGPEFVGQDLAKQADKLWRFLDNVSTASCPLAPRLLVPTLAATLLQRVRSPVLLTIAPFAAVAK